MQLFGIDYVAAESGVSSRTLRHYHAIGLLIPAATRDNGVRQYDQAGLLRLQNILVLRDLGLSLKRIREVIDEQVDPIVAIEGQLDAVEQQKQRLIKIQNALENTKLRLLEGEQIMLSESFDGFENDPYAQEAEQRWPDDYAKSQERVSKLTSGQQEAVMEEWRPIPPKYRN
jgi:DNA-binding transcriptional MerR regulator